MAGGDEPPDFTSEHGMTKGRLEAFSDGVIAIIITIMVLELRTPAGESLASLRPLVPVFLSYVLSFVNVGIYWNNHHHLFQAVRRVGGSVLWANLDLLFWLSLMPFTTHWMGESHFARWPVIVYGVDLICAAVAYTILVRCLVAVNGRDSALARAVGRDTKGYASLAIYATAVALAFIDARIAGLLYAAVAIIWLVPDRRIEKVIVADPAGRHAGPGHK
jgi:uncharacterized membrane protein